MHFEEIVLSVDIEKNKKNLTGQEAKFISFSTISIDGIGIVT